MFTESDLSERLVYEMDASDYAEVIGGHAHNSPMAILIERLHVNQ